MTTTISGDLTYNLFEAEGFFHLGYKIKNVPVNFHKTFKTATARFKFLMKLKAKFGKLDPNPLDSSTAGFGAEEWKA